VPWLPVGEIVSRSASSPGSPSSEGGISIPFEESLKRTTARHRWRQAVARRGWVGLGYSPRTTILSCVMRRSSGEVGVTRRERGGQGEDRGCASDQECSLHRKEILGWMVFGCSSVSPCCQAAGRRSDPQAARVRLLQKDKSRSLSRNLERSAAGDLGTDGGRVPA